MRKRCGIMIVIALVSAGMGVFALLQAMGDERESGGMNGIMKLPPPKYDGSTSVEQALLKRRSVRGYKEGPLTLSEVSQLLWAAQGITDPRGLRTAPSAGALYPLEIYVVIGDVSGIKKGVYKYEPHEHGLAKVRDGEVREDLAGAALGQTCVRKSAAAIVFSAVYERTTRKYGERGVRYVHMEVGHAAQNIYLQAASLDLGTVVVGAFHDNEVTKILNMPDKEHPLCIMPVGKRGLQKKKS